MTTADRITAALTELDGMTVHVIPFAGAPRHRITPIVPPPLVSRLLAIVEGAVAEEREACAALAEQHAQECNEDAGRLFVSSGASAPEDACQAVAWAIRERGAP